MTAFTILPGEKAEDTIRRWSVLLRGLTFTENMTVITEAASPEDKDVLIYDADGKVYESRALVATDISDLDHDTITGGHTYDAPATWTPSYGGGGSMDFTSVTTHEARYIRVGGLLFFRINVTGTTVAPASTTITFTLPVAPEGSSANWAVGAGYDSANLLMLAKTTGGSTTADVWRSDFANWNIGASKSFTISGCYVT